MSKIYLAEKEDLENYISRSGVLDVTLLASSWSSSVPYTQTVTANGIKSTDVPIVRCGVPTTLDADNFKAVDKAFNMIDRVVTGNNTVTFYCYSKLPSINIPVKIKI